MASRETADHLVSQTIERGECWVNTVIILLFEFKACNSSLSISLLAPCVFREVRKARIHCLVVAVSRYTGLVRLRDNTNASVTQLATEY